MFANISNELDNVGKCTVASNKLGFVGYCSLKIMKTQGDKKMGVTPVDDLFITVCEAARILNRSAESVRAYEKRGILPVVRTSRGMRLFRVDDVRQLAEKQGDAVPFVRQHKHVE